MQEKDREVYRSFFILVEHHSIVTLACVAVLEGYIGLGCTQP